MAIKDYGWIGLDFGDTLISIPFISKSVAMTFM
jgi:hypothetical protein